MFRLQIYRDSVVLPGAAFRFVTKPFLGAGMVRQKVQGWPVPAAVGAALFAITVTLAATAQAADEPAQSFPAYDWSGCYAGGSIGAAMSHSDWRYRNSNPFTSTGNNDPQVISGARFDDSRGVLGAQVGCNAIVSGPWLVGLEASWMGNALNKEKDNGFDPFQGAAFTPFSSIITNEISSVFSITGRLGYALNNDWMIYAKGGYALAKIATSGFLTPSFPIFEWSSTNWQSGWTVGGGVEYRLFRNVTIGAEYAYYNFGSVNHTGPHAVFDLAAGAPANPVVHGVKADMHTVMARVNFGLGGPVGAQEMPQQDPRFTGTFSAFMSTGPSYTGWTGSRGSNIFAPERGKGYQIYTPMLIGLDYDNAETVKLETRFRGGHVYARHDTPGQTAAYNGPIDSEASINATFQNFDTIKPTLGVSFNIPTGTSYLPNNQRFARMDSDLVDIGSFGAGFNVNPTAGFVIGLNESTALSLSAGYAWQGPFTKEGIDPNAATGFGVFNLKNRIDPGDVFTANANLTTQLDKLSLQMSFAYMSESIMKVDGMEAGKSGGRYVSNLVAQYQFDEQRALTVSVSHNFQEKNEIPAIFGGLIVEPRNSNSHLVTGSVEPSYMLADNLKLAMNYSFLYRSANFYDQINNEFIPAKTKHSVGGTATYSVTETCSIELKGAYSWIHQDTGALLETATLPAVVLASLPPSLNYQAWAASITANLQF